MYINCIYILVVEKEVKFEWASGFETLSKKKLKTFTHRYNHLFDTENFKYKFARGRDITFEDGKRKVSSQIVIEAQYKNGVVIRYGLNNEQTVLIHLIERNNGNAFSVRNAVNVWKKNCLDLNQKKFAYGRPIENQYKPQESWRWKKKGVFNRLCFYWLRQGFVYLENGIIDSPKIIYLPSTAFEKELATTSPADYQKLFKFKHRRRYENEINK